MAVVWFSNKPKDKQISDVTPLASCMFYKSKQHCVMLWFIPHCWILDTVIITREQVLQVLLFLPKTNNKYEQTWGYPIPEIIRGRVSICSPYSQNSIQKILYWFCVSSHRQGNRQKTGKGYIVLDFEVSWSDSSSLFNRGTLSSVSLAPQSYISIIVHLVSS